MTEKILAELKSGSKTVGQLKDACNCDYPALFAELSRLVEVGDITHYMAGDPVSLHYRAVGIVEVIPASHWQLLPKRQ
jgi:hypothetical protein